MGQFRSIKISQKHYEAFRKLSEATNHLDTAGRMSNFHINNAFDNYLKDVAPIYRQKAAELQAALAK